MQVPSRPWPLSSPPSRWQAEVGASLALRSPEAGFRLQPPRMAGYQAHRHRRRGSCHTRRKPSALGSSVSPLALLLACSSLRVSSGHSACTHQAAAQDCWIPLSQADDKKCAQLLKSKELLWPGDWLDQLRSVQRAGTGPFAGDFSGSPSFVPFMNPEALPGPTAMPGATCCQVLLAQLRSSFSLDISACQGGYALSLRVFCRNESGAGNSEPT